MENGHEWSWKVLEMHRKGRGKSRKTTVIILYAPCKLVTLICLMHYINTSVFVMHYTVLIACEEVCL